MANKMRAIHPGEILREDYLKPLDMSANALAREIMSIFQFRNEPEG